MNTQYQVIMGSYTVKQFAEKIEKGELEIAPFQRNYKWHKTDNPKYYLDSLQQNIFTMPVILAEYKGKIWIIDGQQRLATLFCYFKDKIPSKANIKWNELVDNIKNNQDITDCMWKDLDGNAFERDKILDTPIGYSYIFNMGHSDDEKTLIEIYDRINNQGIPLNNTDTLSAYAHYSKDVKILKEEYEKWPDEEKTGEWNLNYVILNTLSKIYIDQEIGEVGQQSKHIDDFIRDIAKRKINISKEKLEKFTKYISSHHMTINYICNNGHYNNTIYRKVYGSTNDGAMIQYYAAKNIVFEDIAPNIILYPLLYSWFKEDIWLFDKLRKDFWKDDKDEDGNIKEITDYLIAYIDQFQSQIVEKPHHYDLNSDVYELFKEMNPELF